MMVKNEKTVLAKAGLPVKGDDFLYGLQIEHILPQTPKKDFIPEEFVGKDEYYGMVYKLGNVLLLESTINQAVNNFNDLSSDWFELKQSEYSKSDVVTSNLMNHEYSRSEERRVGKECRYRWWRYH